MNSPNFEEFQTTKQILLGLENLYPEEKVIQRVRFSMESLINKSNDEEKVLADFFVVLKTFGAFPLTPMIEPMVVSKDTKVVLDSILKLLDHLSYDTVYEDLRLILVHFRQQSDSESLNNLLVKFLNNRRNLKGYEYCGDLVSILLEKNDAEKIKKLLDFYYLVYQNAEILALKKAYEHFCSLGSSREFLRFLYITTQRESFDKIRKVESKFNEVKLVDAFSQGQLKSKIWAIETLKTFNDLKLDSILLLCGWYGIFILVLDEIWPELKLSRIRSIDIDPSCGPIAEDFNKKRLIDNWNFKALNLDIRDFSFTDTEKGIAPLLPIADKKGNRWNENLKYDIWVNTSCEHIENFGEWYDKIPEGQLVLLQSNDFFDCDEHVNCVNSTAEFRKQTPMKERLFSGALPLEKYTRYMVIGYK